MAGKIDAETYDNACPDCYPGYELESAWAEAIEELRKAGRTYAANYLRRLGCSRDSIKAALKTYAGIMTLPKQKKDGEN